MRRIFCFFVLIGSLLIAEEPNVCLLTHAKSGTNWMMYCMTELTGRGWRIKPGGKLYTPGGGHADRSLKSFYHTHFARRVQTFVNPKQDFLILLLRNYKECLIRYYGSVDAVFHGLSKQPSYFENLQLFDHWDPDRRLLIYYEDLMRCPEETLAKMSEFIKKPDQNKLNQFMQNFSKHNQRVLRYYRSFPKLGGTQSSGDLLHHSKKTDEKELAHLDDYVQREFPDLFEKYLWMYAQ